MGLLLAALLGAGGVIAVPAGSPSPSPSPPVASSPSPSAPPADAARLFDYDAAAPLDLREKGREEVEGASVLDVSYASPKGGRVPAYLVVPAGKGPFAGILFMHWGQGDRAEFLSEALAEARAGALSLLIDAPYWRPDYAEAQGLDPEQERDLYVQLVCDLRRGVDVLLARADVDPARIGYVGHSLGATWGGALAGVEPRIQAYVLMGGLPRLTDVLGDDAFAKMMQARYGRAQLERYVAVLAPTSPERFVGRARAPILFQFARHDRFISGRAANEYASAATGPKEVRWYFTSHEFNDPDSPRDRAEWLAGRLGLARGPGGP